MQRLYLFTGCAIALALVSLLGACDDGPTRPSPQNVPVTTTRIEITGPDTVAPGESAQFSATAYQSDGSTRDVSNEVEWRSGNHWVLTISATGLATGHDRGEASIGAGFAGRTAWKSNVVVVPPGTYRLAGTAKDAGLPVSGARVEVTAGIGQGLVALTNSVGYRLYGVSGDIEVRLTQDGYQEQRKSLQVTTHEKLDFDLVLSRPRDEIAGTYTLTVTAAADCRSELPEEARIRTYTAVVEQDGPRLTVSLEGSKFVAGYGRTFNSFHGTVEPSRVTFLLNGYYDHDFYLYLPDVLEQLATPTLFSVSGSLVTTVSPAGLSGSLDGVIETLEGRSPGKFQRIASCRSSGHQFVFSR
jgi:Big-like domain-containing protein